MSVFYPEATPTLAATKIKVTADIADPAAPKLATEINAATSVDVSLTFRDWNPTMTPESGTAPPRLGTREQMPQEGRTQYSPIEVRYPYDPQADDTDPNNSAKAFMAAGSVRDVVVRKGPDIEVPFAVADRTETWAVRCGKQVKTRSGDAQDSFGEFEIVQMLYPLRGEGEGVVVA